MSSTQDSRNESRKPARLVATICFVLVVAMGYAISPQVEGAIDDPNAADDQFTEESYDQSGCAAGGLAFSDCFLDF